MLRFASAVLVAAMSFTVFADSVALKSGVTITDCTILQDTPERVVFLYGTGILRVERNEIASATKGSVESASAPATPNHLPDYRSIVTRLGGEMWASDLQQIPATVVSVGVMRNVPYKSHRCGEDYEVNVYGDPHAPAGFEIGIKNALLNDTKAQAHCIDFVCSLLTNPADRDALRAMKMSKDSIVRDGVTYEITPPTDPDAYGGWWVSVYSEKALNSVRASDAEIAAISVPKAHPATPLLPPVTQSAALNEIERRNAWTAEELRHARVVRIEPQHPDAHDRVYSRDYTRHEGVYVPHHHRTVVIRR